MNDELGPFQNIWNAWNEADEEIKSKPLSHFRRATDIQFDEIENHLKNDDREAMARELVDIISISLNAMRWLGYSPEEINRITMSRAKFRMEGQALSILDKYQKIYNI
ncbi:hypothetical protein NGM33_27970 [Nocardiopsis dassonvillei]|uniref:hypothetical protein n=1 Tax=Nocardiopsis dassonvillei TaxID=2014 RepID=UPI00102C4958|nr:hypothetical protein [Nocardiopsis dassonvillei]MCP3017175.1 hypothetical protein [Nocardiopsis dassonvillei]